MQLFFSFAGPLEYKFGSLQCVVMLERVHGTYLPSNTTKPRAVCLPLKKKRDKSAYKS
jgi:hypothetical protein